MSEIAVSLVNGFWFGGSKGIQIGVQEIFRINIDGTGDLGRGPQRMFRENIRGGSTNTAGECLIIREEDRVVIQVNIWSIRSGGRTRGHSSSD